jgi:hypothetical protein
MIDMLKRHEIQVLRRAGHAQTDVAQLAGVSLGSVRRVEREAAVTHIDTEAERGRRAIGRPAKAEPFRSIITEILAGEPGLLSVEILRRAKLKGYPGGKTALYELIAAMRPKTVRPLVRFEGLPGEFSQHDFGQVDVRFLDGTRTRVHFFASRLKVRPPSDRRSWGILAARFRAASSCRSTCRRQKPIPRRAEAGSRPPKAPEGPERSEGPMRRPRLAAGSRMVLARQSRSSSDRRTS